jgi:AraC-like DNA-binding protein
MPLLDRLQDVLCWIKDGQGRFVAVNSVLAGLLGLEKAAFVGKGDEDLHTQELASIYRRDDAEVMREGRPMLDKPELINTASGKLEWWTTSKIPLRDPSGRLIGTAGISRHLGSDAAVTERPDSFAAIICYARENIARRISVRKLGLHFNMSIATIERRIREYFGVTPQAFLFEIRMNEAGRLLNATTLTIAEIADRTGYDSPSSFTRAFRGRHGLPPGEFRRKGRPSNPPRDVHGFSSPKEP